MRMIRGIMGPGGGENRHGAAAWLGTQGAAAPCQTVLWSLENNDIPRSLALRQDRCTLRPRSADQRGMVGFAALRVLE